MVALYLTLCPTSSGLFLLLGKAHLTWKTLSDSRGFE